MADQRQDQEQSERLKKAHLTNPRPDRMDDERGKPFRKPEDDKQKAKKERPQ